MNKSISGSIGAALAAVTALAPATETRQSVKTGTAIELICVAEQPAIVEGENVTLRAWTIRPDGEPARSTPQLEWQSADGRIAAEAGSVRWDLSDVKVPQGEDRKRVVAVVTADDRGQKAECSVEVFIGRPAVGGPNRGTLNETLLSARRFLMLGQTEEPGYGLYSYLLFSGPPADEEQKARYLKTIEACLLVFHDVDLFLQRHVRPSRLNATYIPLTVAPKPGRSNEEWAANVLAVYDYATAQILLASLDRAYRRGPYLISVLGPLSSARGPVYLFEELTGVVPELAADRIKFFSYLAAQERSWSETALERFTLNLRNVIAVGARVAPDAMRGLIELIPFKRGA